MSIGLQTHDSNESLRVLWKRKKNLFFVSLFCPSSSLVCLELSLFDCEICILNYVNYVYRSNVRVSIAFVRRKYRIDDHMDTRGIETDCFINGTVNYDFTTMHFVSRSHFSCLRCLVASLMFCFSRFIFHTLFG